MIICRGGSPDVSALHASWSTVPNLLEFELGTCILDHDILLYPVHIPATGPGKKGGWMIVCVRFDEKSISCLDLSPVGTFDHKRQFVSRQINLGCIADCCDPGCTQRYSRGSSPV